jgi:hypothetical protein
MKALPNNWASPEDFATLFQYFWHRDHPIDTKAPGAQRVDWTIHIGIIVRSIGDLMGFVTRFEIGGRKDAVYRSEAGDEVALEWEWSGVTGQNEIGKLKAHKVWRKPGFGESLLKYGVLITYLGKEEIEAGLDLIAQSWKEARWPLLVITVISEPTKSFSTGRSFCSLRAFLFNSEGHWRLLREAPASPWKVDCSRWQWQSQNEEAKQ